MAHLLIIDDDPDTLLILTKLMEREGHTTLSTTNAWDALAALNKHHFDLVLLDIMMPELDGARFLEFLRKGMSNTRIRVVVITALDPSTAIGKIGDNRVDGIVIKKGDLVQNLLQEVRALVGPGNRARGDGHEPEIN